MNQSKLLEEIFSNANLSKQEMEGILKLFLKVSFKSHDLIFKKGHTLNEYYFLESGFIRSYTHDYEGDEVTTGFYSEPEIVLDWTSFMLRKPTQENFQAITDCECWALEFKNFQHLFNSIEGFRELGRERFANSYHKLKTNHLSMISLTAKERYLLLLKDQPEIINKAQLKHIATYLGITDTSLSRIRKEIVS